MTAAALIETRTTCPYCGVGCGVIAQHDGVQITGVRGDPDHPANFGRLCSKGANLHLTTLPEVAQTSRLLTPGMRVERSAPMQTVSWDSALDSVAERIAQTVAEHGPDSVGIYVSGQLLTEDYYAFNKLTKALIGTQNIDTNSRLCMSSAVAGYKATLGTDSVPCSYEDIDHARVLFISGSNTAFAHPVLYRRIEAARAANPDLKIIVVDPRRTDTAAEADLHLPILPGTDVMLYQGMLHIMLWESWIDRVFIDARTEGFDQLKAQVRNATPAEVARVCGIDQAALLEATRLFATQGPTLSLYCQGLNQSADGTHKNAALINLHLATGQIGKPGAGPFSLTGQPNAMGGREVGGLANLLPAHRDLSNPAHRAEVAAFWGIDEVPTTRGKTAVEMFEAARTGQIKLLWIVCTNPAHSLPNQQAVHEALSTVPCVIVQDAFASPATLRYADIVLPATPWAEKDGTVTNSERRISRQRAVLPPMGEARHDWLIAAQVAQNLAARWGRLQRGFAWADSEAVWNEWRELTRGTDCDITGMSYAMLDAAPQQWPLREGEATGAARLFTDGRFHTPSGRARFVAQGYKPVADRVDAQFPLALTTGRLRDQWHGLSRTGLVPKLFAHAPEPRIEMNGADMGRRGLREGDLVAVESRRGRQVLPVAASDAMRSGQAFMAMHWGEEYLGGAGTHGVNSVTSDAIDPVSRQPELKHAAVRVSKLDLSWRLVAHVTCNLADLQPRLAELRSLLLEVDYWALVPTTLGESAGITLRMANATRPPQPVLDALGIALNLAPDARLLRYADAQRGVERRLRVVAQGSAGTDATGSGARAISALWLSGPQDALDAEGWLRSFIDTRQDVSRLGAALLAGGSQAPVPVQVRGAAVCSCLGVSEPAIRACLAEVKGTAQERLAALQARHHCGTQCGSCLPELKRLVTQVQPAKAMGVVSESVSGSLVK
ncbi:molybdopterin-dependent oxidoreductase [Piscinibacterium candidicorallinum]|uniref:Molybdopterin-dependent oxidoreductase n=1 Tax=Piscinibacterium candidicorallinum TaxID=1793872 RepID=A0ABV7H2V1_9BURK